MSSFYVVNLAVFAALNIALFYHQNRRQRKQLNSNEPADPIDRREGQVSAAENQQLLAPPENTKGLATQFQIQFFSVYAFAVAADWLQGPHIYAIYKYEKNIPEEVVAYLYATGFIAGAVSASFAGLLADRYGRRRGCLAYCLAYSLTCLSMLSDNLPVLFIGRICGGVATTLLFSVFEAWLVTEYHRRGLSRSALRLSTVFSAMTTLSSIVAILSGITGDLLIAHFDGARTWPFMAAAVSSTIAAVLIIAFWPENTGNTNGKEGPETRLTESEPVVDQRSGVRMIMSNRRILGLGLTSTVFEGTMYLFVFFWSAAMKSARSHTDSENQLPFGLIFSSFMCAMMAGSALYAVATTATHTPESSARVLLAVVLTVSGCLSAAVLQAGNEKALFWTFCLIELCIGAYFPSMSYLKSRAIEDNVRGRVYSLLRLPLNVFVVGGHILDQEGDEHRKQVFMTCAALLMVSFFIIRKSLG